MRRSRTNTQARQKIAQIAQEHNLVRCEVGLAGCMGQAHAPAHRHKRRWYYDKPDELLWDLNQWVASCQSCHNKLEFNQSLTAEIFIKLRGQDDY